MKSCWILENTGKRVIHDGVEDLEGKTISSIERWLDTLINKEHAKNYITFFMLLTLAQIKIIELELSWNMIILN